MEENKMKRGIVFDLDGTLWDSSQEVVSSWNEVLKNYQKGRYLITLEQMKEAMGLPMLELGKKLWPSLAEEEILPLLNECMEKENLYLLSHPGKLYPHVKETLEKLHSLYPLYIVSNAQKGYIEAFLQGTSLSSCFDDYLCWGDTLAPKEVTMKALQERNHLEECIYVGDTLGDELSSRKASFYFIHAGYGFGKAKNPDKKMEDFSSLPSLVQEIFFERG